MKAKVSENAGVHRRLHSHMPTLPGELHREGSSDLHSQDRGIQSVRRLECAHEFRSFLYHFCFISNLTISGSPRINFPMLCGDFQSICAYPQWILVRR